jgi:hypothetical protein
VVSELIELRAPCHIDRYFDQIEMQPGYVVTSIDAYEQKYRQRTLSYLEKKAQALGFKTVPHSSTGECVS